MRNIITWKNLNWIDIVSPAEEDVKYLEENFKLHPLTLKTLIPYIHHPDLDVYSDYIFIILHYPDLKENGEIKVQELDLIVGKDYLITSHYEPISPLNHILDECLKEPFKREGYMQRGNAYLLYKILNKLLKEKLARIDKIEEEIDSIEKDLFAGNEKKMVKEISFLKRKIFTFWRIVEPQEAIFEFLKNISANFFSQEFKHYFSAVSRNHKRIETLLKTAKESVESLEETNHILLTVKINEIIRTLTIFSVILLPLTLIASVWGMNTNFLPFVQHVGLLDFWLILAIMIFTLFAMILYFRNKKWL